MVIVTLAGHTLCMLPASLFTIMFASPFFVLPWRRNQFLARIDMDFYDYPFSPDDWFRSECLESLIQLICILLALSFVLFVVLLLRHKNTSLVWLGITVLLELGMIAAFLGYNTVTWSVDIAFRDCYLLPFFFAPILTCFGVKATKTWVSRNISEDIRSLV